MANYSSSQSSSSKDDCFLEFIWCHRNLCRIASLKSTAILHSTKVDPPANSSIHSSPSIFSNFPILGNFYFHYSVVQCPSRECHSLYVNVCSWLMNDLAYWLKSTRNSPTDTSSSRKHNQIEFENPYFNPYLVHIL